MSSIYGLLNIGRNSLMTQQKAIDITGNNIANVNTPGYSRQRLNLEQNEPVQYDGGQMSTGVKANRKIQRIYDRFLNAQINGENEELGRWGAQKEILEKAELMFDDASGYGLSSAMSQFWASWQDVTNNPSGRVERVTLLSDSQNLTDTFNKLSYDLTELRKDADLSISATVEQINPLTEQIADLNLKIEKAESGGAHNANDYRDKRDLLVKELSNLIDVQSFEDGDGYMHIYTANGKTLVDRSFSWDLETADNGSGYLGVYWVDSQGVQDEITSTISGGKLKGWIEARDTIVPDYLNRLDTLSSEIINQVNTQHRLGYSLDGTTTNQDFFTGTTAVDMAVDSAIESDVNLIAAASTAASAPGDETNALAIVNLQHGLFVSGSTFDNYYGSIISDVGSNVVQSTTYHDHQETMLSTLENYREEVSGVSLDEEMVNLVQFQSAYQAAAKIISTVDEMLDSLMTIV
jgi:flagellar hook-associated protein 1 FlgK